MNTTSVKAFNIIGISTKTSNLNGESAKDIPALWQQFLGENLMASIPEIINQNIHCVYTDYEGDHMKPYTVLLGMQVASLLHIPKGMTGMSFAGGKYTSIECKGNLHDNIVYTAWEKIWSDVSGRAFTADFEVYDASMPDPTNTAVDIFVALK